MSEPFLCWCPLGMDQHEDGECPTRTEWLEIEDSELPDPPSDAFSCQVCDYTSDEYGDTHAHPELHDLADVAAEFGVDL